MAKGEPSAAEVWAMMVDGAESLAEDLALGKRRYVPEALAVVDEYVAAYEGKAEEEDVARLGFFLARLLVEQHDGGLIRITEEGHPLEGEWAMSGFERGLAEDYCVPFLVSASRILEARSLTARDWYAQILAEGR